MSVKYYPINEDAARRAKEMNSFSDYVPGSATAEYQKSVDKAAAIAEAQKRRVGPEHHERIDYLLDLYARKLAENKNNSFAIDARVPSVMIAGPANFPMGKKEKQKQKQNAARERNMAEWQAIQVLLDKIRSTGMGGISADDANAIPKLEQNLAARVELQEHMKAVNAYYRKHKTLDGCPGLSQENIQEMNEDTAQRVGNMPYPSYTLTNNNAEIRRLKERIAALTRQRETDYTGWEFDGGEAVINREENRLQILFYDKPDEAIRTELKSNGFRWSPKAKAWQRQLNDNAFRAADYIKAIWPVSGEKPSALQRAARTTK